jgi:AmiR/NasT family two-component response regulator
MNVPRVLIVEDEAIIAMDLERMLTHLGCRAVGAVARCRDVLPAVQDLDPDVILMDIRLDGEKDGIELATELYARAPVVIVFVTAFSDPETVERMAHSGAYACVIKPVDEERLHAAIRLAQAKHEELLDCRRSGD